MIKIVAQADGFDIVLGDVVLIAHRCYRPAFTIGEGTPDIGSDRGHFALSDTVTRTIPLRHADVSGHAIVLAHDAASDPALTLRIHRGHIALASHDPAINRLWLALEAERDESVWGCGEQMSYLNLRGRRFPLWTGEPGVGRDPVAARGESLTTAAHMGDYWTTYYPQPTFLSSRRYALHADSRAYAEFDFTAPDRHLLEIWDVPARLELFSAPALTGLVSQLADRFGKQPPLPDWAISGVIVGLKDGTNSFTRLDAMIDAGVAVTGLWCEDWAGIRETSFGKRLFWDWQVNDTRYPDLAKRIVQLRGRGIRFLGYVNPYLAIDGPLYERARQLGHLVLHQTRDEPYLVDFGEFTCAMIDLTHQAASDWFIDRILQREMLDAGMSGWMADFGEYLPADARLANGSDPLLAHNEWPVLWAQTNARAIAQAGNAGDRLFFMRAGHSGIGAHCPLLWAGDQSVDFSRHDGIGTAICAALSAGLLGNAYHHSDIGGYTSLNGNIRSAELIMRWAELSAFTPVMRSHEGNRPEENLQVDSTPEILSHFAYMTRVHAALAPYMRALCDEASDSGLPLQRPLFLHYPQDLNCLDLQFHYLLGRDVLVVPVIEPQTEEWPVYLPEGDDWLHLWSARSYAGGTWLTIDAPLGAPPVFYRKGSPFAALFDTFCDPDVFA
ncbi:MAG: alpha-glucosidase [Pontixanthobacter sp.]